MEEQTVLKALAALSLRVLNEKDLREAIREDYRKNLAALQSEGGPRT